MKTKNIRKTAVIVFTLDPGLTLDDPNAESGAWAVDEYEDDNGTMVAEATPCEAWADTEAKLQELFGKGLVATTMFDEDDLGFMAKRFRKPESFLKRLLSAGRP